MGYRIDYAVARSTMRARVSGRSSLASAASIAREIRREASRAGISQLVIDVRGLYDRIGTLGTLVLSAGNGARTAVIDTQDNERYHPFCEHAARLRGLELRCFCDPMSAMEWLAAED